MAKPVRYGEKPTTLGDMMISPINDETNPNVEIDNCSDTNGTPLNIDKPSLTALHFPPANCTTKSVQSLVSTINPNQQLKRFVKFCR